MTKQELDDALYKVYGFSHFDPHLKMWQIMIDDISVWITTTQLEDFTENTLSAFIAKRIVSDLTEGKYPKEIYVN